MQLLLTAIPDVLPVLRESLGTWVRLSVCCGILADILVIGLS